MHYMARRFYAPVLVTARKAGDEFIVSAVHDLPEVFETEITLLCVSVHGEAHTLYQQSHRLSGDGHEITRLDRRAFRDESILIVQWTDEKGVTRRSHVTPVPYKHLALPNPALTSVVTEQDGAISIVVAAKHLALYVALECDVAGHFSDNAFDLLAGESSAITFTPDNAADLQRAKDTLLVRDLFSSSH
jgi:beta-mannosidase